MQETPVGNKEEGLTLKAQNRYPRRLQNLKVMHNSKHEPYMYNNDFFYIQVGAKSLEQKRPMRLLSTLAQHRQLWAIAESF